MRKLLFFSSFIFLLQSCGEISSNSDDSERGTVEKKFFAEGVKLISAGIKDPRHPSSMQQGTYTLNETSRLLTRLEGMGSRSTQAVVDGDIRMYVVLSSDAFKTERSTFETAIELCPITKNWMMLATWDQAHPFPTSTRRWGQNGGDYSRTDCVTADTSYENPNEDALYFDVSDWYLFYVRSRDRNYGLMVKTSQEVTIYGDEDSLRAPHFIWKE